jgi:hypothetical protein
VVIGVISLASALSPMGGHISNSAAPPVPPAGTPVPPASSAPESFPRQGQ